MFYKSELVLDRWLGNFVHYVSLFESDSVCRLQHPSPPVLAHSKDTVKTHEASQLFAGFSLCGLFEMKVGSSLSTRVIASLQLTVFLQLISHGFQKQ